MSQIVQLSYFDEFSTGLTIQGLVQICSEEQEIIYPERLCFEVYVLFPFFKAYMEVILNQTVPILAKLKIFGLGIQKLFLGTIERSFLGFSTTARDLWCISWSCRTARRYMLDKISWWTICFNYILPCQTATCLEEGCCFSSGKFMLFWSICIRSSLRDH